MEKLKTDIENFYENNIVAYIQNLYEHPASFILLVLDLTIVLFLLIKSYQMVKGTRMWQLIKGVLILIIATILSGILRLSIVNYILTQCMTYSVIALIVIFQPELRRGLEQLGTSKFSKFFGLDNDIQIKTKENIYKVSIAVMEMATSKTGALIVFERDIKLNDIIETGIIMNSEISPQLLVNIFVPKTPLHDGAVVISENKIAAASCMLPLANDQDIAKELGTRHRAAIGISKETDSIVVVVSEETGKVSIAREGTLIADVKEETLKKILIKYLITSKVDNQKVKTVKKHNNNKKTK